jgi:hypothetical protein
MKERTIDDANFKSKERRSQENYHIGGPSVARRESKGQNGNPTEIRFEETQAQRKRDELL